MACRWLLLSGVVGVLVSCGARDMPYGSERERTGALADGAAGSIRRANGSGQSGHAGTPSLPDGGRADTSTSSAGGSSAGAGPGGSTSSGHSAGSDGASALVFPPEPRVVVVGDLHGDIGVARTVFQLAGATNEDDKWIGGALTVVQMGDLIGRSDDDREVLDFMFVVQQRAEAAGGRVYALIGNHEVMAGRVDNQAVGPNPFPGFEGLPGLDLSDPRLEILPENERGRGAALMAGGPYARRLAEHPCAVQIGKTIYVHGGLVPRWAEYGIDKISEEVSQWLLGNTAEPDSSLGVDDGDRIMWTRQFSANVDANDCAVLDQTLSILGAERMIVSHTVHATITPRCDDKVWAVDVGMSRAYGGPIELLELIDDEAASVIRP